MFLIFKYFSYFFPIWIGTLYLFSFSLPPCAFKTFLQAHTTPFHLRSAWNLGNFGGDGMTHPMCGSLSQL